jgi:hypothetical protein
MQSIGKKLSGYFNKRFFTPEIACYHLPLPLSVTITSQPSQNPILIVFIYMR